MDYYNVIPYRNLAIGIFSLGVFTYYGISLINLLVTIIYPIIKIQAYISDQKILTILERKKKKIPVEDLDFIQEALFWLKYWCVFALWYVIEYYLYYIPLISYAKLSLFLYVLIKHDISNSTELLFYDYIDNLVFKDYKNILTNFKPFITDKLDQNNMKYLEVVSSYVNYYVDLYIKKKKAE
jgi:hypothetical protein